jgi:solute carrier family 13 (sodium-dependent dicarboxylate transporter), member 2/3/5
MSTYQQYGFLILLLGYFFISPLMHLALVVVLCLAGWFIWPKNTLITSNLTCFSLVIFGHVPWMSSLSILGSHPVILLVVGCLMAQVIIKNEIHLILSAYVMQKFKPSSEFALVLLMMGLAGFLSMWISNTSVVAMLIPVVIHLSKSLNISSVRLLLSIAYGATIGGMLTPIGTPANLVAVAYASRYFGIEIDFVMWFSWAAPFVMLLGASLGVYFWSVCQKERLVTFHQAAKPLQAQKQIMMLLGLCVFLWASQYAPHVGWSRWLNFTIKEEYLGLAILSLCALISYKGQRAVSFNDLRHLPYPSIWMVVTGIFIAEGMMERHVISLLMAQVLDGQWMYNYQTLALFGFMISLITELCSNTAVTSLGLPLSSIMMKLSHLEALPCIFLITLSANSAFMLPTATPPNALILGTGKLSSKQLISVGLLVSLSSLCILVVLLAII